jgi:hypothetical protein
MVERLVTFATREFGRGWMGDLLGQLELDLDPELSQLVGPCSLYEWPSEKGTMAELWLASSPRGISDRERGWLAAQGRAWLSIWEVREVTPNVAVRVRDFLTGEERYVLERSGTEVLTPRDAVLGRVVDFEGWLDTPIPALSGMTPREAAAKPRKRKELVLLLKEIENHESRAPKEQHIDLSVLWTELGLEDAR